MAKCGMCGEEVPQKELFRHQWDKHREQMREVSGQHHRQKGQPGQPGDGQARDGQRPPREAARKPAALSPINAALVEFVNQTFVIPNNPALVYGFLCAKKLGFEGDMGMFLMEVIDDFYDRRHMNYYQEVAGWDGIGDAIRQLPESDGRAA